MMTKAYGIQSLFQNNTRTTPQRTQHPTEPNTHIPPTSPIITQKLASQATFITHSIPLFNCFFFPPLTLPLIIIIILIFLFNMFPLLMTTQVLIWIYNKLSHPTMFHLTRPHPHHSNCITFFIKYKYASNLFHTNMSSLFLLLPTLLRKPRLFLQIIS